MLHAKLFTMPGVVIMASHARVTPLFEKDNHRCLLLTGIVEGEGIDTNQFVIVHDDHAALFDPGGDLTYTPLTTELSKHINLQTLDYVCASHQDPDVIASLPRWLMYTCCRVVTSRLWDRFLPHLVSNFVGGRLEENLDSRIVSLPDEGKTIPLGASEIQCIPAHFLHSVGNFHFYDPISRILFTGDVGAAVNCGPDHEPVEDFERHVGYMEGFHRRYMAGNKVCRNWAGRIRKLDPEMLVPQHGRPFVGKEMVEKFLNWFERLECGIDLIRE